MEDIWARKPFSYIHMRSLSGAIKDWFSLLSQAYEHLEPGGYLEVTEFEVWVHDQRDEYPEYFRSEEGVRMDMIRKWQEGLTEAGDMIGRRFDVAVNLRGWLEGVGFEGVTESVTRVSTLTDRGGVVLNCVNRSLRRRGQKAVGRRK